MGQAQAHGPVASSAVSHHASLRPRPTAPGRPLCSIPWGGGAGLAWCAARSFYLPVCLAATLAVCIMARHRVAVCLTRHALAGAFALHLPGTIYVWRGSAAPDEFEAAAATFARQIVKYEVCLSPRLRRHSHWLWHKAPNSGRAPPLMLNISLPEKNQWSFWTA